MSRLLIVDGHAYAYRAFYAIRHLRSPTGQAVNAVYGFLKMLEKMRAAIAPSHLMVVWDGGLSAERMAALPECARPRPRLKNPSSAVSTIRNARLANDSKAFANRRFV